MLSVCLGISPSNTQGLLWLFTQEVNSQGTWGTMWGAGDKTVSTAFKASTVPTLGTGILMLPTLPYCHFLGWCISLKLRLVKRTACESKKINWVFLSMHHLTSSRKDWVGDFSRKSLLIFRFCIAQHMQICDHMSLSSYLLQDGNRNTVSLSVYQAHWRFLSFPELPGQLWNENRAASYLMANLTIKEEGSLIVVC